jgi:hypothetical protein
MASQSPEKNRSARRAVGGTEQLEDFGKRLARVMQMSRSAQRGSARAKQRQPLLATGVVGQQADRGVEPGCCAGRSQGQGGVAHFGQHSNRLQVPRCGRVPNVMGAHRGRRPVPGEQRRRASVGADPPRRAGRGIDHAADDRMAKAKPQRAVAPADHRRIKREIERGEHRCLRELRDPGNQLGTERLPGHRRSPQNQLHRLGKGFELLAERLTHRPRNLGANCGVGFAAVGMRDPVSAVPLAERPACCGAHEVLEVKRVPATLYIHAVSQAGIGQCVE